MQVPRERLTGIVMIGRGNVGSSDRRGQIAFDVAAEKLSKPVVLREQRIQLYSRGRQRDTPRGRSTRLNQTSTDKSLPPQVPITLPSVIEKNKKIK